MDERYERWVVLFSAITLVAAGYVVAVGMAGYGASPLSIAGAIALTILLLGVSELEGDSVYLARLWLGPLLATVVLGYSAVQFWHPGEVQTVGGLVGLVGVVNLFLRPVYRTLFGIGTTVRQIGREMQDERERSS